MEVEEKIIKDLERCDLIPYIKKVECSILLMLGDKDERIDYKNTLKAEDMFKISESSIIKGTGYSYE